MASRESFEGDGYKYGREAGGRTEGSMKQTSKSPPTKNEKLHMKPTNNFEDITEEEFDRRERLKAEYRRHLQEQINEQQDKKDS